VAKGSLDVTGIVAEFWREDGRKRPFVYVGLPLAAGIATFLLERQVDDLGSLQAGSIFLAAMLMNVLLRVWNWGEDVAGEVDHAVDGYFSDSELRRRLRVRLDAVARLQRTVSWAVLVSFALVIGLVVANTRAIDVQQQADNFVATIVLAVLGTHLMLVLVATVNRTVILTRSVVTHNKTRLSSPSD
jgi:hypothetical protein